MFVAVVQAGRPLGGQPPASEFRCQTFEPPHTRPGTATPKVQFAGSARREGRENSPMPERGCTKHAGRGHLKRCLEAEPGPVVETTRPHLKGRLRLFVAADGLSLGGICLAVFQHAIRTSRFYLYFNRAFAWTSSRTEIDRRPSGSALSFTRPMVARRVLLSFRNSFSWPARSWVKALRHAETPGCTSSFPRAPVVGITPSMSGSMGVG